MLLKSDAVHEAWAAAQRTVGIKLTIKEAEYDASDITSLTFDSGAMNGEALTLGSTYQNTIKVVFSRLIEGLALTDEITPELGIKLPDGTWDYTPLGVFVIDAEVQQDRNNNTTTISASDRMCMMGGTYESKLTYPAAINDIAVEIANLAAVKLNDDDFARLPTDKVASFGSVTYRDAIGYVAQFAGGFATFDRDGLLDIRQLTDPNFEVTPSQYQSKGLTKNEALYRIGGIACTVTTTTKDDSGNETQDTKTLQSGSSAGTQITISNPGMTQDLLDGLYEQLQDLNFYPFSLSWFGDPNVEAGDWIEVQDTAGNTFKTPNLLYALTFSGGITATSKADTTVSASANFVYRGQLNQVVNNIRQYLNASGHAVSEGIDEPTNPKAGDIWFKKDGPDTTIMTYVVDPETGIGSWSEGPSTKPDTKITDALQQAEADVAAAQKQADDAVTQALAAVNASGLATASAQAASDAATAAKQLATEVSNTMATVQSQASTAASDAATALDQAKSALATANGVSGDYTTLKKIVDDTTATVSTLATQTSVDAVKQTVTTTKALAEQTANGLTLKADTTTVDTINNTVKQQAIDIKAAQDQLALMLTASDLTKGLSGYATQTWASQQITATANSWKTQLSTVQTQIGNIGQKNLVYNSELISSTDGWTTNSNISVGNNQYDHYNGSNSLAIHETTMALGGWHYVYSKTVAVVAGDVYSASATFFVTGPDTPIADEVNLEIDFFDASGARIGNPSRGFDVSDPWTKQLLKVENQAPPENAVWMCLAIQFNGAINLMVNHPMLVAANTVGLYQASSASDTELAGAITRVGLLETTSSQYLQRLTQTETNASTALTNIQNVQADVNSYTQQLSTVQQTVNCIGQVNLVDDSEFENITNSAELYISRAAWPDGIVPHLVFERIGKSDWTGWQSSWVKIDDMNQSYSASMSVIGASAISCLTIEFGDDSGYRTSAYDCYFDIAGTAVQLLKVQGVKPDTNATYVRINWNLNGSGKIAMREPMLVAAPVVGPYVASRVTISAYNTIKSTVDKTVQTIGDASGLGTTIVNSISGLQNTVTGKASQTQVTQLDNRLTSVVGGLGQTNLVYNSEVRNDTEGWSNGPEFVIGIGNNQWDAANGSNSLAIHAGSLGEGSWHTVNSKPFTPIIGQTYAASAVLFVSGTDAPTATYVSMTIDFYDRNGNRLAHSDTQFDVSNPWAKQTLVSSGIVAPSNATSMMFSIWFNGAINLMVNHPMLVAANTVGLYQPDTVGSSQITQLQGLIDQRVMVDGKIAAALSLSADGGGTVLITGKSVHITGDTTIDNAVIKSAMIDTITADKIITGTLNAGLINVIGMNASAISAGTITGPNLAINLNTGQVTFQSGRIHSADNTIDINIDQKYLSVADGNSRVLLKGGQLQFVQPQLFDLQTTPYLSISNQGSGSNWAGATFIGRDSVVIANSANTGDSVLTWALGKNTFSGLMTGKNADGVWNPTILGGAERGVVIVGGALDDGTVQSSPMIRIGSSTDGQSAGNRIYVRSSYLIVPSIYSKTTGSSANVVVLSDGSLHRSTSASKYKTMIERSRSTSMAESLIALPTAHWLDKAELTNYANGEQSTAPKPYFGMIAEDLAAAGLEDLVQRGDTGELEGINYDRIAPALLPLLAKMKQEIEELKSAAKSA